MFQSIGFLRHFFLTRFALFSVKEYKENLVHATAEMILFQSSGSLIMDNSSVNKRSHLICHTNFFLSLILTLGELTFPY